MFRPYFKQRYVCGYFSIYFSLKFVLGPNGVWMAKMYMGIKFLSVIPALCAIGKNLIRRTKYQVSFPQKIKSFSAVIISISARRITKNPEMFMHPSSYGIPSMSVQYPPMDYYNNGQHPNSSGMHKNYSEMHQEHGQYSNGEQYNFKVNYYIFEYF